MSVLIQKLVTISGYTLACTMAFMAGCDDSAVAGGYEIPASFLGRSLFGGSLAGVSQRGGSSAEAEEAIRERLSGLGYIS